MNKEQTENLTDLQETNDRLIAQIIKQNEQILEVISDVNKKLREILEYDRG